MSVTQHQSSRVRLNDVCRRDNGLPFDEDLLYLRMESGDPTVLGSKWENSLYVAAGPDPFILVEKAVAAAAQLSGGAQQRQDKQQPDSLDWFGWCTWDAYYSKVSARGTYCSCLCSNDCAIVNAEHTLCQQSNVACSCNQSPVYMALLPTCKH